MIEHITNCRELGEIKRRQADREVIGGDALEACPDRARRPERPRQRGVDKAGQKRQRDGQHRNQAPRFVPRLGRQRCRIDRGNGFADLRAAEEHRPHSFAPGIE